jgi:hypothetical protein
MPSLPDGIIVERTPMRDLARRLVEVLHDAGIPAWMAARPGVDLASTGALVRATSWDIRVAEDEASRARSALGAARRLRLVRGTELIRSLWRARGASEARALHRA